MEKLGTLLLGKPSGEDFDLQKFTTEFQARFDLIRRSSEEQEAIDLRERAEKEEMFLATLEQVALEQFGIGYTRKHRKVGGACGSVIQGHIQHLLKTGMGACYTGRGGSGKTNILLEYFLVISFKLWLEQAEKKQYPDPRKFIEKTVRFSYALHICRDFKAGIKVPLAQYNLIDDLGVECPPDFIFAELDGYFEEINRRDLKLVVSTNSEKETLETQIRYHRIYSRIKERCRIFELPDIDYRDPKNWVSRTK
jgi:hypothetical protein